MIRFVSSLARDLAELTVLATFLGGIALALKACGVA